MDPIPRESKEYLPVPIVGPGSLNSLPVEMAVKLYPERPLEVDWHTAVWGIDLDGNTVAQILIGPGSPEVGALTPGTYVPYVRVTSSPEEPVIEGDPVKID